MECREAVITKICEDRIIAAVKRNPMCSHCRARDSCIDSTEGGRVIEIEFDKGKIDYDLKVDDIIIVEYKSSKFLTNVFFAYLVPSMSIVIAVLIGQGFNIFKNEDLNTGVFFVFGLLFGLFILVIYEKINKKKENYKFKIKKL